MTNKSQVLKRYPNAFCRKERRVLGENVGSRYVTMYTVYLDKNDENPEYGFSASQAWKYTLELRILPQTPVMADVIYFSKREVL